LKTAVKTSEEFRNALNKEEGCQRNSWQPFLAGMAKTGNNTEICQKIKTSLDKAEALIIGAGAGLSAASGLLYDDTDTFNKWFPGYHDRYGLQTINEIMFYHFPTREEYYAFWIRLISTIRYNHPAGKPYLDLHRILHDKEYFILTTNTDGQFLKAGFPPEKLCTPQGDYTYFQCSLPCNTELHRIGMFSGKPEIFSENAMINKYRLFKKV
jgi:NAD-dependent SIR2 family protein deacetylase